MDRARHAGAAGPRCRHAVARGPRRLLSRPPAGAIALAAALLAVTCSPVGIDLDAVVALEVGVRDSAVVEEGDTIVPFARALNGRGDSVAAEIVWATLDTATLLVVDTATGATLAKRPATPARLQARVGALRSAPLALTVRPAADTLFAAGPQRDTVTAGTSPDSLSDSLIVRLQDLTSNPAPGDLANRPVVFEITYPSGAGAFTLEPADTVLTTATGRAAVRARLLNRVLPDSVVVSARALRANGQAVPGTPVTFVVEFVP